MPSKRDVLEQLKRDELLAAADRFELEIRDRRVREDIAEALASSRKAGLAEVLEELPRTRLKEICRALNLDDSGREKALLVARLTGKPPEPKPSGSRSPSLPRHGGDPRRQRFRHLGSRAARPPPGPSGLPEGRLQRQSRLRGQALGRRRQAARPHGRRRVQARRPRPDLPQVHLRRLRGEARGPGARPRAPIPRTATSTSPRASSGCPRRPAGPARKAPGPGPKRRPSATPSTRRWAPSRRRTPRSRASCRRTTPGPPSTRPASASSIDLIATIGLGDTAEPLARTSSAGSTNTSSASSPRPRASAAASSTRPQSVVKLLVEMLEPYQGRVYDPCCGSGGMFVAVGDVRRGPRRPAGRPLHLRPGVQPHDLAAGAG